MASSDHFEMGRRNWRRKQVTVHEVEEVTITRKKRKTYVLEEPATIEEVDQLKNKTKKPKPPLITNFDYGLSRTKLTDHDDDSDYAGHGEIAYEEEKEQNKEVCSLRFRICQKKKKKIVA